MGDVEGVCHVFNAAQADPSLALQPQPQRHLTKRPQPPPRRRAHGLEEEPAAGFFPEEEDEDEGEGEAQPSSGRPPAPHYLYTMMVAAFAHERHGAWPAALYMYEDFLLRHGAQALEWPLATAVARCLNCECVRVIVRPWLFALPCWLKGKTAPTD